FMQMDVNEEPDVDLPLAVVSISQPGAVPSELETQITRRVEAAVRGVNGVDEIHSQVREGNSTTQVQFDLGTPIDRAITDIRDAVA
ncbi:efflux RND transporter permease subunit, partial [Streptomyces sp. URMC 126]|uniref:efflux RND transporter permease subunit n=1 Tax=Streptomyces sp. URMC 126 TaxID=3423401 RepID=UPI003F1BE260